ncbi:MAG: pentapeptide repeat-containing protein [Magnetococcales bacterium]|nr:pentapeptide repeat-containing protein [Magnetococcales bacterium]
MIEILGDIWNKIKSVWEVPDPGIRLMIVVLVAFSLFKITPEHFSTYSFWAKNSEDIRNLGLVIISLPGLCLLLWRTVSANRSAEAAIKQAQTSKNLETLTQKGHLTDRFSKAVELLGHDKRTIQIGGIKALERIAIEDPKTYHRTVYELLCVFVKDHSPAPESKDPDNNASREPPSERIAVQAAMTVICRRDSDKDVKLDLTNANLSDLNLKDANLSGANLYKADLRKSRLHNAILNGKVSLYRAKLDNADFFEAELKGADFSRACMRNTILFCAKLEGAKFYDSNISNADFGGAKVTDEQLLDACIEPKIPPRGVSKELNKQLRTITSSEKECG